MEKINLLIEIHGGMGDQICAEPVLRFMKSKWSNYDISIITNYPELFQHLNITVYDENIKLDKPVLKACTHPKDHLFCNLIDFQQIHTIDYISLILLKMTLNPIDKQIKINIPKEIDEKIKEVIGDVKNSVIIHPGMSWQSKTFPSNYWKAYIDILLEKKHKVIVIGKNYWANKNEYRGVVEGLDLSNCLNLIDTLSTLDLCSVIKHCPILISNDSAPIHLAGAFDNVVGVISTVRRPETLFHWRKGIHGFNYYSLEEYPIYNDLIPDTISGSYTYNSCVSEEKIIKALPDPNKILNFVKNNL